MAGRPQRLIAGSDARTRAVGDKGELEFDVRLISYRSLPLSCVRDVTVTIDGEPIAPDRVALVVDGHRHRVADLGERIDLWWFVLDQGQLVVSLDEPLSCGEHTIGSSMSTSIPYATGGRSTHTAHDEVALRLRELPAT